MSRMCILNGLQHHFKDDVVSFHFHDLTQQQQQHQHRYHHLISPESRVIEIREGKIWHASVLSDFIVITTR